jgi:hypothetical protein
MATLVVKDYFGMSKLEVSLAEKSGADFVDAVVKKWKKLNKEVAHKIAEDILSRYDIVIEQRYMEENLEPFITISYRRKKK